MRTAFEKAVAWWLVRARDPAMNPPVHLFSSSIEAFPFPDASEPVLRLKIPHRFTVCRPVLSAPFQRLAIGNARQTVSRGQRNPAYPLCSAICLVPILWTIPALACAATVACSTVVASGRTVHAEVCRSAPGVGFSFPRGTVRRPADLAALRFSKTDHPDHPVTGAIHG